MDCDQLAADDRTKERELALANLCWYDPRNPDILPEHLDLHHDLQLLGGHRDCYCDPCFYGRHKLAVTILSLLETL